MIFTKFDCVSEIEKGWSGKVSLLSIKNGLFVCFQNIRRG